MASSLSIRFAILAIAAACLPAASFAQGSAELTFQAYASNDSGVGSNYVGDVSLVFRELQPGFALISGSLNGGVFAPAIRRGQSYLSFEDMRFLGGKVGTTVGDFDVAVSPLFQPSSGLTLPNSSLSGVLSTFAIGNQRYVFFQGSSYLLNGARIPYRYGSGQKVVGGLAIWNPIPSLKLSGRMLHIGSNQQSGLGSLLNPLTENLQDTLTGGLQATWTVNNHLDLFGEAALSFSQFKPGTQHVPIQPFSGSIGGNFRYKRLIIKATDLTESANYLPLAGFYSNGRSGAVGEIRVRPIDSLQVFASGSVFRSLVNLAPPQPQTEHITSATAGFQSSLGKTTISGNYSALSASSTSAGSQTRQIYNNSFSSVSVGRQFGSNQLRATWEDISLSTTAGRNNQQTADFEDGVHFASAVVGGAIRYERTNSVSQPANLAARFFWNWTWRRLSTFGSFEKGSDLAGRSILTTSGTNTSSFGLESFLGHHWTFKGDALRTRLLINLNPENTLLLVQQGIGPTTILNSNHWTVYVALTRHFSWRGGDSLAHVADMARAALPQVGTVEGLIMIDHGDHSAPGWAGIPLVLDNGNRSSVTGPDGHFRFSDVPEGIHTLGIDVARLPVDFNPPAHAETPVLVVPRRLTRSDFTIQHVGSISGLVRAGKDAHPENLLIRLDSGQEYTSVDANGHFEFSSVADGQHKVFIDPKSLAQDESINGPQEFSVVVKDGQQSTPVFDLIYTPVPKPVRRIYLGNTPPE